MKLTLRTIFASAFILLSMLFYQNCSPTGGLTANSQPSPSGSSAPNDSNNPGAVKQTVVLPLTSPNLKVKVGETLSLTTQFNAIPMDKDYVVFIHFFDSVGNKTSFNADYTPSVPATSWSGLVSENRSIQIPFSASPGNYTIKMGLFENAEPYTNRVALARGSGVTGDAQLRYTVGTLVIEAASQNNPSPNPANLGGPVGQDASQYNLTFSDEFDQFRSDYWHTATFMAVSKAYYQTSAKNWVVEDGRLKIFPLRDNQGNFFNIDFLTEGKFEQTYGYFEVEAKLPYGKGCWPAFWLFKNINGFMPEIDVMEAYSGGGPGSGWSGADLHPTGYAPTVWVGDGRMAGSRVVENLGDLSAGFHTYGVKWEPNRQTFYFDGTEVLRVDISMSSRLFMLLSLQFGSASGPPDNTTPQGKGNSFEVNYVRAWQFK